MLYFYWKLKSMPKTFNLKSLNVYSSIHHLHFFPYKIGNAKTDPLSCAPSLLLMKNKSIIIRKEECRVKLTL